MRDGAVRSARWSHTPEVAINISGSNPASATNKRRIIMRKFALVAVTALLLSACDNSSTGTAPEYQPSDPGGVGITYNGKIGIDTGGGVVIPFDGSSPGAGFGL